MSFVVRILLAWCCLPMQTLTLRERFSVIDHKVYTSFSKTLLTKKRAILFRPQSDNVLIEHCTLVMIKLKIVSSRRLSPAVCLAVQVAVIVSQIGWSSIACPRMMFASNSGWRPSRVIGGVSLRTLCEMSTAACSMCAPCILKGVSYMKSCRKGRELWLRC